MPSRCARPCSPPFDFEAAADDYDGPIPSSPPLPLSRRPSLTQVYILVDTSYNAMSVDEVAAAHVSAQCIVHYGRASLTPLSRTPAFYVFPVQPLDCQAAAQTLSETEFVRDACASAEQLVVFLDQVLLDSLPEFSAALRARLPGEADLAFADVRTRHADPESKLNGIPAKECCGGSGSMDAPACGSGAAGSGAAAATAAALIPSLESSNPDASRLAGYTWSPSGTAAPSSLRFVWVGTPAAPALTQLQLTHSTARWLTLDPATSGVTEGLPPATARALRRRYFLVEKARVANIVGVVVGTLGAAGYGDAVQRLRRAAQAAGKKTYTILVGKPSPAKLANFPEIEVRCGHSFVLSYYG